MSGVYILPQMQNTLNLSLHCGHTQPKLLVIAGGFFGWLIIYLLSMHRILAHSLKSSQIWSFVLSLEIFVTVLPLPWWMDLAGFVSMMNRSEKRYIFSFTQAGFFVFYSRLHLFCPFYFLDHCLMEFLKTKSYHANLW